MTNPTARAATDAQTAAVVLCAAVLAVGLAACADPVAQAASPVPAGSGACAGLPLDGELSLQSGGSTRTALVHLPDRDAAGAPYPVVLVLHWLGGTSAEMRTMTAYSVRADASGFVAVYPQAIGSQWDLQGGTDVAFISALIDRLTANGCADASRVYATGMSLGAGMANVLGCRLSERIAAIGPVSGPYGPGWEGSCSPSRAVPVIAFHGMLDGTVPYAGGEIRDGGVPAAGTPPVAAVETWAAGWAERNGCSPGPVVERSIGQVDQIGWERCTAPVEFYRVRNGGHSWPGTALADPDVNRDVSATDLTWTFFSRFRLASAVTAPR